MGGKHIKVNLGADGVAIVTFSRPPVNAFNTVMWQEIPKVFDNLSLDPAVRVVVLASTERAFTGGIDLKDIADFFQEGDDSARIALQFRPLIFQFQNAINSIENCRVPVIAAVHGFAFGLGVDILSACDVRYATEDATFSVKEVDIGMAADVGSLARFPKTVGNDSSAREIAVTARIFSAKEAEAIGFVSKLVPGGKREVLDAALVTAKEIATKSPIAVAGTKHVLLHSRDHTALENLDYVATWNAVMFQTADTTEAINSFLQKRRPRFGPLASKL
ncbi:Delta2-dienoyl-CoA-isomerase [Cantharellus anzutake]|uniref:Delta2-dienoyl-CoA-isomerase n=1 Tax=Cantharellus anzutake TaxID=1750568 RepID=UPI001908B03D|nr:Delta2-dienoyl-CoA-isomerase [Cantharellus anzutake]KAF8327739.1 Delta2-dienoyl-CoA-isomerase [Cantharellus anzutake]